MKKILLLLALAVLPVHAQKMGDLNLGSALGDTDIFEVVQGGAVVGGQYVGGTPYRETALQMKSYFGGNYTLPIANSSVLGGVKQGAHVTIANDGTISVAAVPTAISQLTNDANFITAAGAPVQTVNGQTGAVVISVPVTSVAGRAGAVTLSASDISGLSTVATSGSYNDLSSKPTIPSTYITSLGGNMTGFSVSSGALNLTAPLGSAAFTASTAYDASGAAAAAQAYAIQRGNQSGTQSAATITGLSPGATNSASYVQPANNLSDLTSAATARANLGIGAAVVYPSHVNLIIDTDNSNDWDDTLVLVMACAMQARGECTLWGVTGDTYDQYTAPADSAILTYGGLGAVPCGTLLDQTTPTVTHAISQAVATALPNSIYGNNGTLYAPNSTTVMRQAVANAPSGSVVLFIGGETTMRKFYESAADQYGPSGSAMLVAKSCTVVVMGGSYPTSSGVSEYNFGLDPAADYVLPLLTVPTYFIGNQMGTTFATDFVSSLPTNCPAYLARVARGSNAPIYDPIALLFAVRGLSWGGTTYFTATTGTIQVNTSVGSNTWSGTGTQAYLSYASGQTAAVALAVQALVTQASTTAPSIIYGPLTVNGNQTVGGTSVLNGLTTINTGGNQPGFIVNSTLSSGFNNTVSFEDSSLGTGEEVYLTLGHDASGDNAGSINFHYTAASSSSNFLGLGLDGVTTSLRVFGTGDVSIGTGGVTDTGNILGVSGNESVTGTLTAGTVAGLGNFSSAAVPMTSTTTTAGSFVAAGRFSAPNLTSGEVVYCNIGTGNSGGNEAGWNFKWLGNNSASNFLGLSFNGGNFLMEGFKSGDIAIGTTTDDGSNILQVTGNTKLSGNLAVTGTVAVGSATIHSGSAAPNSSVTGNVGDIYLCTAGGSATTLWVKESGAGTNTGWVGK